MKLGTIELVPTKIGFTLVVDGWTISEMRSGPGNALLKQLKATDRALKLARSVVNANAKAHPDDKVTVDEMELNSLLSQLEV